MVLFKELSLNIKQASNSKIFWNSIILIALYYIPFAIWGFDGMWTSQMSIAILSIILLIISDENDVEIWEEAICLWFFLGALFVLLSVLLFYTILRPTWRGILRFNKWLDSINFKRNTNRRYYDE